MILRELKWLLVFQLTYLSIVVTAQNDESYDNNDWIPITPNSNENLQVEPKRAMGRVLNLDAPAQKFFPDNEYHRKKRPQVQQYLRETVIPPKHHPHPRQHKHKSPNPPYKYENIQGHHQPPLQYFTNKEVKIPTIEQPPPLPQPQYLNNLPQIQQPQYILPPTSQNFPQSQPQQPLNQDEIQIPNLYDQYNVPVNISLYQSLNPSSINQELLGAIQNTPPIQPGFQQLQQQQPVPVTPPKVQEENQTVQLLYVPLENLKPNQPVSQGSQTIFQKASPPVAERQILNYIPNTNTKQTRLASIENDFIQQALQAHKLQEQIQLGQPIIYQQSTTSTTPKPKPKRKPHQPPLAVYMTGDKHAEITDVLNVLKDAKTISVQDTIQPNSPKIFIGPSTLDIPNGYSRFPLPYLNNVSGSRVERKIDQLPFFVAPLSYKAPPGYSKIPLPSPHVGSVVISHKDDERRNILQPGSTGNNHNQINQYQYDSNQQLQSSTNPQTNPFNYNDNNFDQFINNQYTQDVRQFEPKLSSPAPTTQYEPFNHASISSQDVAKENNQYNSQNYNLQQPTKSQPSSQEFSQFSPVEAKSTSSPLSQFSNYNPFEEDVRKPQSIDFGQSYVQSQSDVKTKPQSEFNQQIYSSQKEIPTSPSSTRFNQPSSILSDNSSPYTIRNDFRQSSTTPKSIDHINQEHLGPNNEYTDANGNVKNSQFINPLELAINQYELHQINTQLDPNKANKELSQPQQQQEQQYHSHYDENSYISNPQQPISTSSPSFEEYTTTTYRTVRTKPQRRRKPATRPAIKPTESSFDESKYTILEDFAVKTQLTTAKYQPKNEATFERTSTTPRYLEIEQTPSTTYQISSTTPKYETTEPLVESIPVTVYKLPQENPVNQHKLNQELMDQQILSNFNNAERQQQQQTGQDQILNYNNFNNPDRQPLQQQQQQHTEQSQYSRIQQSTAAPKQETDKIEPLVHNRGQSQYFESIQQTNLPFSKEQHQNDYAQPQQQSDNIQQSYIDSQNNQNIYNQQYHFNQQLPGVSNLQEQAVRPLLVPNLLVPTTEQENSHSTTKYEANPSTERIIELTSKVFTTDPPTTVTTTTARSRTRGRGRGNSSRYTTSTVQPTRRSAGRRRPIPTRTTTERVRTTTEYLSRDSGEEYSRKTVPNTKQRFRTRGRPTTHNSINDRVAQSTTENEINAFKSPSYETGFQASQLRPRPNSYMQFEHVIDDQKIITIKPELDDTVVGANKEYHQVFNSPNQNIEPNNVEVVSQYQTDNSKKPVVDVQITHPVTEPIAVQTNSDSHFVRQNANVQSGGVFYNNKNNDDTTTTRATIKTRGRTRGRSRFATTTTVRPTSRVITTTETLRNKQNDQEDNEFFGFIRQPNFSQKSKQLESKPTSQPVQLYSSTYQSSQKPLVIVNEENSRTYSTERIDSSTPIRFLGEIRPKYQESTSLPQIEIQTQEPETEAPKTVTRNRIRVPTRKAHDSSRQSINEVSGPGVSEQATRRSSLLRSRGRTHYKVPENIRQAVQEDNEEELNYPPSFFKNRESTSKPSFQITIDPNLSEDLEDQAPHSSLYRPKFVPKPSEDWTVISNPEIVNQLDTNEQKSTTEEPVALQVVGSTTEAPSPTQEEIKTTEMEDIIITEAPSEITTRKKGRRRGVWKLIKQKPVDHFETAESQNYQTVLNNFDRIEKVNQHKINSYVQPTSMDNDFVETATESEDENEQTTLTPISNEDGSLFDTLYEMFGINEPTGEPSDADVSTTIKPITSSTITTIAPTFPEELTEFPTTEMVTELNKTSTSPFPEATKLDTDTDPPTTETEEFTTVPNLDISNKNTFEVEPWEMRSVKTSTSTEISHETEICYKGRCVKSKNRKVRS